MTKLRLALLKCIYFGYCTSHALALTPFNTTNPSSRTREEGGISFLHFKQLLVSEINNVFVEKSQDQDSRDMFDLQQSELAWNSIVEHGWGMSRSLKSNIGDSIDCCDGEESKSLTHYPYLFCYESSIYKSAYQRIKPMIKLTQMCLEDYSIVRNDPHMTCFHVSLTHDVASSLRRVYTENSELENQKGPERYLIIPLVDLMKVKIDTFEYVADKEWTVPLSTSKEENDNWERVISVAFSAGYRKHNDKSSAIAMANKIIDDLQCAGQKGSLKRKRNRRRKLEKNSSTKAIYSSLSEKFSMINEQTISRRLRSGNPGRSNKRQNKAIPFQIQDHQWSRSLEFGLEADHGCKNMFETLDFKIHYDNQGFDIVLNPKNRFDSIHNDGIEVGQKEEKNPDAKASNQCGIECTASNRHCVISLIMGLSTHPMVLSIESGEGPVISNDYESQWITQTKVIGSHPMSDIGINGENQIISIADSGLDINHKYFGPTSTKVFNVSD